MSAAQAKAFLEDMNTAPLFQPDKWTQLGIAEPEGLTLLGDLGLFVAPDSREVEIGYTLARSAQGRGLATAAVRELPQIIFRFTCADHAIAITDARNHASICLLERVGMRKREERNAVFCGEPCVEYVYFAPRDEGSPQRKKQGRNV